MVARHVLNVEKMQRIANSNPTASAVFLSLYGRERFRDYTNLPLLKKQLRGEGVKLVADEFVKTFQELEDAGVGKLNKEKTKFSWYIDLKKVAKAGVDGVVDEPKTTEDARPAGAEAKPAKKASKKIKIKRSASGNYIQIVIPAHMVKFIKTDAA